MRSPSERAYDATEKPSDPRFDDLSGRQFGRLTVASYAGRQGRSHYWKCKCECSGYVEVLRSNLTQARTLSCGCLHSEIAGGVPTHGMSRGHPEFAAWSNMKDRCLNSRNHAFKHYGARGIQVHSEWITSFEAFFEHIGPRPSPRHSIDRIDNDGNYEPGNVRWATKKQQANNRRPATRSSAHEGAPL